MRGFVICFMCFVTCFLYGCESKKKEPYVSPQERYVSLQERYETAMTEFANSDRYHAVVCQKGKSMVAYRTLLGDDLNPRIRFIAEMEVTRRHKYTFGTLFKDGKEIRILRTRMFNLSTRENSQWVEETGVPGPDWWVNAYPGETVRAVFDLPYESKDQFDITRYKVGDIS